MEKMKLLLDSLADCYSNLRSAKPDLDPADYQYLDLCITHTIEKTYTLTKNNSPKTGAVILEFKRP